MRLLLGISVKNAKSERTRRRGTWLISEPQPRSSLSRMEQRASNSSLSATLVITVKGISGRQTCFHLQQVLIYLASADAVLRDYQDNVIDRTPLSSLLDISGRGKPATPRRAQKRAVRGVASRHNCNYCTLRVNNPLISDTQTYLVAPCTIPVVAPSVNPSAQDPQHLDNGTVQTWITPHLGNPAGEHLQTSNLVLCPLLLLSPPLTLGSSDQQPSWADTAAGILGATNPFLWYTSSVPVNAPPLSQHAVQPAELRSSSPVLGMVFL